MSLYIKSFFLLLVIVSCSSGGHTKDRGKDYFLEKYIAYVKDIESSKYPKNIEEHRTKEFIDYFETKYGEILPHHLGWDVQASFMKRSSIKNTFFSKDGLDSCITLIGKNFQDIPMVLDVRFVEESEDWRIEKFHGKIFESPVEPRYPNKASCPDKEE